MEYSREHNMVLAAIFWLSVIKKKSPLAEDIKELFPSF